MKKLCKIPAIALAAAVLMAGLCPASSVPTEWTVRIGPRSAAYQAERRHGDALALKASLVYNGQPLAYSGPARLYAQTNGMGAAWWDLAPCTVNSNILEATWLPSFDTGADVVDIFLGGPSNYQAAARIRFLPSPGAVPNSLPLPVPVLDFAQVVVTNAPFATFEDVASALRADAQSLSQFAATGTVARAITYGTPTRWTDATGCVWETTADKAPWTGGPSSPLVWSDDQNGWLSENSLDWLTWYSGTWTLSSGTETTTYTCSGEWDAMRLVLHSADDRTVILERGLLTKLVGRVALTNELPPTVAVVAPSTNAASGAAADAKATGTALYTGFTEWEFSGVPSGWHVPDGFPVFIDEQNKWELDVYDPLGEPHIVLSGNSIDNTSLTFVDVLDGEFTIIATRHLITPTKTSQLTNDGSNGVPFVVGTQLGTKQDALPYPTNSIPFAAISGAPTSPSVFYAAAGGAATVSGATLTYQAASNSVGTVALLAGTNVLHITAPSAITGHVRDFGLTVSTEDAATITLDSSVSWRFDAASTNLAAGSWNRVYCTESPANVFTLQLWTPDSAQEATP